MIGENDLVEKPHRQPAYDAVYAVIGRTPPRSTDSYGKAAENARVWRAVEAALDAMERVGILLPAGTETVEQWSTRLTRDGLLVPESEVPMTREQAQKRVDYHARMRAENPGWRGVAELVRRHQHTTPWESAREQPTRQRCGLDDLLEELGDVRIQFWVCPVAGHSDRNGADGRPVVTVEWRGDIAYCTADGCGRNSQGTTTTKEPS